MKTLSPILSILFFSISTSSFAQQTYVKRINTNSKLGDVNVVTAGNGDLFVAQNTINDSNYLSDLYCIRLNNKGKKVWEKVYSPLRSIQQQYNKMVATADNGFFLFAKIYDYTLKEQAGMILKCDSMGNIIWSKKIVGSPGNNYLDRVQAIEDEEGNYLIVYATFSFSASQKMQLIKFNKSGEVIFHTGWDHIYDEGTYQNFTPETIVETQHGGFLIGISYDCAWCQTGPRSYLLYSDKNGKVLSYKQYTPNHPDHWSDNPTKLIKQNQQYYLLGQLETWDDEESKYYYYLSPIGKDGTPGKVSLVNNNIYSMQKFLGEKQLDFGTVFRTTYTKNSMISYSSYGDYIKGYGLLIGKYDSIGRICPDFSLPEYQYDTSTINMLTGAEIKGVKKYIDSITITDRYLQVTDVEFSKTNCSAMIPSTVTAITSTESITAVKPASVFPNPAKASVTVSYTAEKSSVAYLHILSSDGKLVQAIKVNAQKGANIQHVNIAAFAKGVYFIRIVNDDKQNLLKFIKE